MNEALNAAEKWLTELGIRTIARPTCLMVNRDDVDKLWGIGVVYDTVLNDIREGVGNKRLCFYQKDREWLYMDSL